MKKIFNTLIFLVFTVTLSAQTVIYTRDGRSFTVPVNGNEISRIEFSQVKTTVVNPFLGKWARKSGDTIVEYMEILQGTQQLDIVFRNTPAGATTNTASGQFQNGEISGKGSTRNIKMKMNNQNQIEYTSSDFNGQNSWSCTWFRVN